MWLHLYFILLVCCSIDFDSIQHPSTNDLKVKVTLKLFALFGKKSLLLLFILIFFSVAFVFELGHSISYRIAYVPS